MENIPTWMTVVALAARDADGRVLLQQRPPGKHHGGLWEFPGGKVEPFENPRYALAREIAEELAIEIEPGILEPCGFAEEAAFDGRPAIVLLLYTCHRWSGEICGLEGQGWDWFHLSEAAELALAPMDRALLEGLSD